PGSVPARYRRRPAPGCPPGRWAPMSTMSGRGWHAGAARELSFHAFLDDRLGEQPEARHRVADHGGDPGPFRAPPLGLRPSHPAEVPMGQHDGGDVHADDEQDLEVPDERRRNKIPAWFVLDRPEQLECSAPERVRSLVDEQLSLDAQVTDVV